MYSRVFTKPKRLKNKVYNVVGFTGKIDKINHNSSTVNDVTNKYSISMYQKLKQKSHTSNPTHFSVWKCFEVKV